MKWITFLVLMMLPALAHTAEKRKCPSNEILATELLEMQVAGIRMPLAKPACLEPSRFKHTRVAPPMIGESKDLPEPRFVDEKRPFTIKSVKKDNEGRLEVEFSFWIEKDGKAVAVEDYMVFVRYDGESNKILGCATVMIQPRALAIRKSCYNP